MKKSNFIEAQILVILKERESGLSVAELCRKHGVSEPTFHNWKKKYAGLTLDELKLLKELEQENARLKKTYSNLSLEYDAIKDLLAKKF